MRIAQKFRKNILLSAFIAVSFLPFYVLYVDASDLAISGVSATNIYNPGAQIVWTTNVPSDSRVAFGTSPGTYTRFSDWYCQGSTGELIVNHCVNLTDLTANTVYYYKVKSADSSGYEIQSPEYQFYSGSQSSSGGTGSTGGTTGSSGGSSGTSYSTYDTSSWASHTWVFQDGSTHSYVLNRTDQEYTSYLNSVQSACSVKPVSSLSWFPRAGDSSVWQEFGIPNCGQTLPAGTTTSTNTTSNTSTTNTTNTIYTTTTSYPTYTSTAITDTTPPVIKLNGYDYSKIAKGTPYSDLGAMVTDNVDKIVGLKAMVDGRDVGDAVNVYIDTYTTGIHTVTYYAVDSSGNKTHIARKVEVYDPYPAYPSTDSGSDSYPTSSSTGSTDGYNATATIDSVIRMFTEQIATTTQYYNGPYGSEEEPLTIIKPIDGATVQGQVEIRAKSTIAISRLAFILAKSGAVILKTEAKPSSNNEWNYYIDTVKLPNGIYAINTQGLTSTGETVRATGKTFSIYNKQETVETYNTLPSTTETITPVVIASTTPPVEPYQVRWECRQVNITDPFQCDMYLFRKSMPIECREKNITAIDECDRLMKELYLPAECKAAQINDEVKCRAYLESTKLPTECREAGMLSAEDCKRFIFKKNAPAACLEAGLSDEKACEEHLFKIDLPPDCSEANVSDPESCKKYMIEKYGGSENIPADKYPPECTASGARTIQECETLLQKKYLPKECQDQGISGHDACALYLVQKYMPKECRDAGVTDRASCDKIMFSAYAPAECRAEGIQTETECRELMMKKYKPSVVCESKNEGECDSSLRARHIGTVVATQQKYEKVRDVQEQKYASVSISELKSELGDAQSTVPLEATETKVKLIKAEESIILKKDDNLVQTSPAALVIDSDADGLTDDFENRFGTNPDKTDSDDDGVSDGDEIRNKNNPVGTGVFTAELAPIDQVIIENASLEHPKTAGTVSPDLKVETVTNSASDSNDYAVTAPETATGYLFKGKAEPDSVITLYIYSDMPLVVTVKTDRYGNWQYELGESLNEGEHEVYVAINDNTGKVVEKSSPLNFFVREAQAFSVDDFIASTSNEQKRQSETIMNLYVIIATLSIIVAALIFILIVLYRNRKPAASPATSVPEPPNIPQ